MKIEQGMLKSFTIDWSEPYFGCAGVTGFEFDERIDLAITLPLASHPVASESERAYDQCQSAAVTLPVAGQSEFFIPDVIIRRNYRTCSNKQTPPFFLKSWRNYKPVPAILHV